MHLIEVAFKGNRKEFFVFEGEELPKSKTAVIVEADRGEDLGHVHATGELAAKRAAGVAHAPTAEAAARKFIRFASRDDERRATELRTADDEARRTAMERVKAHSLVMKVSDAEWQWDRKKLTLYFTAERRVDFRALVRDLASTFRTRIELKQIGVRDEAKRLDGIGRCGRQYCSASWLPELRPVNLQVAKDQHLSLNPSQISGACGRLMCCLRYEHEFYVQSRKRFPKEGKILVTTKGEEKVVANDIFGDRVTLRAPDGEMRVVALAELKRELAGQSDRHTEIESATVERDPSMDDESATDELVPDGDAPTPLVSERRVNDRRAGDRRQRSARPAEPRHVERTPSVVESTAEPAPETTGVDDNRTTDSKPPRRRGRRGGRRNRRPGDSRPGASETPPAENEP